MKNTSYAMDIIGYEPKTTFWQDFTIADRFGIEAIKDTYKRSFRDWKTNHIYLTELVMVLNHKIWQHYGLNNHQYAKLYDELWKKTDQWSLDNLKDKELEYYVRTLD